MDTLCFYALGDAFDVDAFVASSGASPTRIWHVGEPKGGRGSPYPTSGIVFEIPPPSSSYLADQEDAAIAFIKQHRDVLKGLGEYSGVSYFALALQYRQRYERNVVGFCITTDPWLSWHLLDINCRLNHYVHLEFAPGDYEVKQLDH